MSHWCYFKRFQWCYCCCFADNLKIYTSFQVELYVVMHAIEISQSKGWFHLWIECNSLMIVESFTNPSIVPWKLRTKCLNYMYFARQMNFRISHNYKNGSTAWINLLMLIFHLIFWLFRFSIQRDFTLHNKFSQITQ